MQSELPNSDVVSAWEAHLEASDYRTTQHVYIAGTAFEAGYRAALETKQAFDVESRLARAEARTPRLMRALDPYTSVVEIARRGHADPGSLSKSEIRILGAYILGAASRKGRCGNQWSKTPFYVSARVRERAGFTKRENSLTAVERWEQMVPEAREAWLAAADMAMLPECFCGEAHGAGHVHDDENDVCAMPTSWGTCNAARKAHYPESDHKFVEPQVHSESGASNG